MHDTKQHKQLKWSTQSSIDVEKTRLQADFLCLPLECKAAEPVPSASSFISWQSEVWGREQHESLTDAGDTTQFHTLP